MKAVPCPTCGHTGELPRMSLERLFFLCGAAVRSFAVMPDDSVVVCVEGAVHQLSAGEWGHYQALCRHSADFNSAMHGEEAA